MKVAAALPESQLAKIFKGELSEQEIGDMTALQLRWEKELGDV
jgi:hypothetical protein